MEREAGERARGLISEGFLEEEETFELGLKERDFNQAKVEARRFMSEWQGHR